MDLLDCLERTVNEMDALEAIYGSSNDPSQTIESCEFSVVSKEAFALARALLQQSEVEAANYPELQLEITLQTSFNGALDTRELTLKCKLPPGYPELPAKVTILVEGLKRSVRDELASMLNDKASSMSGQEAIMVLVEEFKQLAPEYLSVSSQHQVQIFRSREGETRSLYSFGRRWIWVHHIKDSDRRKSIVAEATGLHLGGFLKAGYPGIIVIEGNTVDCEDFVAWVKGNKSRPGGFGRNWGHHVRGHVDFNTVEERRFTNQFTELEDMAILGKFCKEQGVEREFLEYVLQHRGSDS